jgi:hypothetical protein
MVEQLKAKKVPWSQLQEYLKAHQDKIGGFLNLMEQKLIEIP